MNHNLLDHSVKFLNCRHVNYRAITLRSNDGSGKLKQGDNELLPMISPTGHELAGDNRYVKLSQGSIKDKSVFQIV